MHPSMLRPAAAQWTAIGTIPRGASNRVACRRMEAAGIEPAVGFSGPAPADAFTLLTRRHYSDRLRVIALPLGPRHKGCLQAGQPTRRPTVAPLVPGATLETNTYVTGTADRYIECEAGADRRSELPKAACVEAHIIALTIQGDNAARAQGEPAGPAPPTVILPTTVAPSDA